MCHLSSRRFLFFFLGALSIVLALGQGGNCQSRLNRRSGPPASSLQLQATKDDLTLTLPLAQSIERPIHANVQLVLVSPEDIVRAQLSQDVQLLGHQKQLVVKLPKPFDTDNSCTLSDAGHIRRRVTKPDMPSPRPTLNLKNLRTLEQS